MRLAARCLSVGMCAALVFQAPAMAKVRGRGRRVLGVVAQTDQARLDNQTAVLGADIYSCDSLETDQGGVLRAKVGPNQLYLGQTSYAQLEDEGNDVVQGLAISGTIGFSFAANTDFSVRTAAGVIRPAGAAAASGQVVYTGEHSLDISAIHGDLTLDHAGELRTIPEGKTAHITFDDNL
jgi:hypothetical protein